MNKRDRNIWCFDSKQKTKFYCKFCVLPLGNYFTTIDFKITVEKKKKEKEIIEVLFVHKCKESIEQFSKN